MPPPDERQAGGPVVDLEARGHEAGAGDEQHDADRHPLAQRALRQRDVVAQGGHRRDAARPPRRQEAGDRGDTEPDDVRRDHRGRRHGEVGVAEVEAEGAEQPPQRRGRADSPDPGRPWSRSVPPPTASRRTDRLTWRRDAPSARSSASSRLRWATRIEKVLMMRKIPTTRATPAKTSRNVVMKPRTSSRPSLLTSTISSPVRTCSPSGTTAVTASASSVWATPSAARSVIELNASSPPRNCSWAARVSKMVRVAPFVPDPNGHDAGELGGHDRRLAGGRHLAPRHRPRSRRSRPRPRRGRPGPARSAARPRRTPRSGRRRC